VTTTRGLFGWFGVSVTPFRHHRWMDQQLTSMAATQFGLFTREQARSLDVSPRVLDRLTAQGAVELVRRGVFAIAGSPHSYQRTVLAALLSAGDAWGSHRTAAKLQRLSAPAPDGIDVLTLPGRRLRQQGVVHHRSAEIRLVDLTRVDGIPVTAISRTLVDCLPWLGEVGFAKALDDAQRRGLMTSEQADEAHAHLDRGRRTGRHLVVPAREPLALRSAGQLAGGSERELDVLGILRAAGLPLPVQQHRVVVDGRRRFLDYAYVPEMVAIEWKGFAEHGLIRSTFDDDAIRDSELQLMGWLMLDVTSRTRPATLTRWVTQALEQRRAA
jgi:hypothetical protein